MKSNIIFVFFTIVLTILNFSSCKHFSKDSNGNVQLIRGKIDDNGEFKNVSSDKIKSELQKAILRNVNDEVTFPINTPFEITIDDLDPEVVDLQYSFFNEEKSGNKFGNIKVVDKNDNRVFLNEKCEIINRGPGPIPMVVVNNEIPKLQVVITPRYNSKCEFIGWEIRNGSIEQGCIKGKDNLNQLKKCFSKTYHPPRYNNDYWMKILFGLD